MGRVSQLLDLNAPVYSFQINGAGSVHELGTSEYDARIPASKRKPTSRAVIDIEVHRVGTVRSVLLLERVNFEHLSLMGTLLQSVLWVWCAVL